jgi:predicted small secreted protein
MRKLAILTLAAVALLVTACNTVEGAGKDMQKAGTVVEKTAKDAK